MFGHLSIGVLPDAHDLLLAVAPRLGKMRLKLPGFEDRDAALKTLEGEGRWPNDSL